MKEHCGSLIEWEPIDGTTKVLALEPSSLTDRISWKAVGDSHCMPPATSPYLPALVGHDAQKPGLKAASSSEVWQATPGTKSCILHRVLG